MYYLNLYMKENGDLILKQVKNKHAYKRWVLIDTYVIYDNVLYKYDDFRKLLKTRKFNFFEKIVIFFREL